MKLTLRNGFETMDMYRCILLLCVWFILVLASLEFYFLTCQHSKQVVVPVQTVYTKDSPAALSKPSHHTTKQNPEDQEAEKDSDKRKNSVKNVCRKMKLFDVFKIGKRFADAKRSRQRFNLLHHLIVNEEYKVLFCFIPKVACSNMKRIFLVMQGLYPSVDKVNVPKINREIMRLDNRKFTEQRRQDILKNYYKFVIVRDPFERLVSAYRNKWQNKKNVELHRNLGKRIVEKYRYNNTKTVKTGDDVTFVEYARYLIDNPPWLVNEHWQTYEELCRPCHINYDFIGTIDTLSRDVPHAMRQIHANETKYHLLYMRGFRPLVKSKHSAASFLKQLSRKYFTELVKLFKTDHKMFGYALPEYDSLEKRYPPVE